MLTPLDLPAPISATLLIIDDDVVTIQLMGEILKGFGEMVFATEGISALALARSHRPDLILLDAEMPGMSGFEVCAALKTAPATAHIPIIFVTAHSDEISESRALGAGAIDFIPKPINRPVLEARVRTHLILKQRTDLLGRMLEQRSNERDLALWREAQTAGQLYAIRGAVQAVVDASPRPVAVLRPEDDGQLVVAWVNDLFADLVGREREAFVGLPLQSVLPRDCAAEMPIAVDEIRQLEFKVDRLGGLAEIQITFTPVLGWVGESGCVLVSAQDLTEDRRAARKEAQRNALEALGRIAGRIAHEINNVLQPIMSHASLARHMADGNENVLAHIDKIQTGVRAGRDIVRSVLALAGPGAVIRQPRSFDAEIARTMDLLAPTIPDRITVEIDLGAAGATADLAPAELLQIMGNLIANAIDAIPDAGTVRVRTERRLVTDAATGLRTGPYAQLLVTDSGAGMDSETLANALEPFFTTKAPQKGTGLGLATVRSLIDGMGGGLSLSSRIGLGTTVSALFPLRPDPDSC